MKKQVFSAVWWTAMTGILTWKCLSAWTWHGALTRPIDLLIVIIVSCHASIAGAETMVTEAVDAFTTNWNEDSGVSRILSRGGAGKLIVNTT